MLSPCMNSPTAAVDHLYSIARLPRPQKKKTPRSAWRATMAPRQLRLEPIVDSGGNDREQRLKASPS
eukprot:scaffold263_cov120-Isochrysis_galbana.AAC.9